MTNFFIANLALADVIIGLFAIPFQFQAALLQRWNLPDFMCPFCPFFQVKKTLPHSGQNSILLALCFFISKDKRIYFCPFLFKVKSQINIHCQAGDKYRKRYSQIENVLLYEILHCMSLNNFEYKFVLRNWYDSLWRILKIFPKTSLTSSGWK